MADELTGPTPTGNGKGPDSQSLIDWLRTLGPVQIRRLKLALGWDDANDSLGLAFINAVVAQYEKLGAEGFTAWTSETIPNATPWNPPPDMGKPPDPSIPKPTDPEAPDPNAPPVIPDDSKNFYDDWVAQMKTWGLWSAEVEALGKQYVVEGWSEDKFLRELRKTQTHKDAFGEWHMRDENGLLPISEGQILQLRAQVTALTKDYYGYTPNAQELANLIGQSDKSIGEFEETLQIYKMVQQYGGVTKQLFATVRGENLDDEDLMEIFNPNSHSQLKKDYEDARFRGLPTLLGFHARSQEEADLLRNAGLTPDEAYQRFQQAGSLAPIMQKLGAIDANVTGNDFLNDVPLETLAKSVFDFTDEGKAAGAEIRRILSREISRWREGGGAASDQSGNAVGLLTPGQR